MRVGYAADLGRCAATTVHGDRCDVLVIKSLSSYCPGHHAQATSLITTERHDIMRNMPVPQARLPLHMQRKSASAPRPSAPPGAKLAVALGIRSFAAGVRAGAPAAAVSDDENIPQPRLNMHGNSVRAGGGAACGSTGCSASRHAVLPPTAARPFGHSGGYGRGGHPSSLSDAFKAPDDDDDIFMEPPAPLHPPPLRETVKHGSVTVGPQTDRAAEELRAEIVKRPASSAGARNLVAQLAQAERKQEKERKRKELAANLEKEQRERRETIHVKARMRAALPPLSAAGAAQVPAIGSFTARAPMDLSTRVPPVSLASKMGLQEGALVGSGVHKRPRPATDREATGDKEACGEIVLLGSGSSDEEDEDGLIEVEPPPPKRSSARETDAPRFSWEQHVSASGAARRLAAELTSHSVAEERVVASVFGETARKSASAEELLRHVHRISRQNAWDKLRSRS